MSEQLISVHLVGRHDDGSVWIQPLKPDIDVTTLEAFEIFKYLCTKAGARLCCTIRCRQEGDELAYYHSFFSEPSPEDAEVKNNALLRIAISGTGELDPNCPHAAENLISDGAVLDSLGITLGENE